MKMTLARLLPVLAATTLLAPPAFAQDSKPDADKPAAEKKSESKMKRTSTGLQYEDLREGTGARPRTGQTCVMHYTGWLWENDARGRKFDSSFDRGQPFEFQLGRGMVIKGWDEGVATMKVGGKRRLLIPPQLAYGAAGAGGGLIPPNATLLFEVELVGVK